MHRSSTVIWYQKPYQMTLPTFKCGPENHNILSKMWRGRYSRKRRKTKTNYNAVVLCGCVTFSHASHWTSQGTPTLACRERHEEKLRGQILCQETTQHVQLQNDVQGSPPFWGGYLEPDRIHGGWAREKTSEEGKGCRSRSPVHKLKWLSEATSGWQQKWAVISMLYECSLPV